MASELLGRRHLAEVDPLQSREIGSTVYVRAKSQSYTCVGICLQFARSFSIVSRAVTNDSRAVSQESLTNDSRAVSQRGGLCSFGCRVGESLWTWWHRGRFAERQSHRESSAATRADAREAHDGIIDCGS